MKWLMVGTAPSVMRTLPSFSAFEGMRITCNGGIELVPDPDVYLLVDMVASKTFRENAIRAREQGATLVTLHRDSEAALVDRKVHDFDEFLRCDSQGEPTKAKYGRFRYSGPLCLEYACHHGASEIHLIGFDGYRTLGDYYKPQPGTKSKSATHGVERTRDVLQPACQAIARAWHDVQFIQYGEPIFSVDSGNWEVVRC